MIRSRPGLYFLSALAAGIALLGAGWVVGALVVLWFMAIAPGAAACRVIGITSDRDWIIVIAVSLSIDAVWTELMLYAHVWTPVRGVVALSALTMSLVALDQRLSRS